MKFNHPHKITELLNPLENLATYGVTRLDTHLQGWLESVGVCKPAKDGQWVKVSRNWITDCLPAQDDNDLLRITAIRDPLYRAHIDVTICSVLHAVGKAERWNRLEELLVNRFKPFSQRFIQLLDWLTTNTGIDIFGIQELHWLDAEKQLCQDLSDIFYDWDKELWGASARKPSVAFPLFEDLYLPICEKPVHVDHKRIGFENKTTQLLRSMVKSTEQGEGITCPSSSYNKEIKRLWDIGLPVRTQTLSNDSGKIIVGTVGAIRVHFKDDILAGTDFTKHRLPWGVSAKVQNTSSISWVKERFSEDLSLLDQFERKTPGVAFIGVDHELTIWPTEGDERYTEKKSELPPLTLVPDQKTINEIGLPRSQSPDVDAALANLGKNLYFGFLLQLFLLESLDRELGEESLILAPPTSGELENIESETQVFYKPRMTDQTATEQRIAWSFSVGRFDNVMSQIAHAVCIDTVVYPYQMRWGPWSRGLHLFRTSEIITGLHDRWALSPHVLDRLHGGGLMSAIIRRGRDLRDKMHEALMMMWTERMRKEMNMENISGSSN